MAYDAVEPGIPAEPAASGGSARVELAIGGMHCQSCVALIEEALAREPGVARAEVDLDAARASVAFDGSSLSVDDLCAAVVGAGYSASPVATGPPVT